MKHLCTNCSYIYDEVNGEVEDGIDYGTRLDDIRESFVCPSCFESSDNFQEITQVVNNLDDDQNVLGIEAEHIPIIEFLDDGEIKVEVNHSDEKSHFLGNIAIYDEYGDLVYEEFFKPGEPAYLGFDISDLDEFEVRTTCNLHGVFSKKFKNKNS